MKIDSALVGTTRAELREAMAEMRSAKSIAGRRRSRDRRQEAAAEFDRQAARRRRERELEELLRWRVRVRVPKERRPRVGRLMRRLDNRNLGYLPGSVGSTDSRAPDGYHSLYFEFTARGFRTGSGRSWRPGEAKRAALYITRSDSMAVPGEDWWSNIGDDPAEVAAFMDVLEDLEREGRANANVYISEIIALPAELRADERRKVLRNICRFIESRGLPYVVANHKPDAAGDQRNFHAHLIYSRRTFERLGPYDWTIGLDKDDTINTPAGIAARRRDVVRCMNAALEAAGVEKRYTAWSRASRGLPRGEEKRGQAQTALLRRIAAMEARQKFLATAHDAVGRAFETLENCAAEVKRLKERVRSHVASVSEAVAMPADPLLDLGRRVDAAAATSTRRKRVLALLETRRKVSEDLLRRRTRLGEIGINVRARLGTSTALASSGLLEAEEQIRGLRSAARSALVSSSNSTEIRAPWESCLNRLKRIETMRAVQLALVHQLTIEREIACWHPIVTGLRARVQERLAGARSDDCEARARTLAAGVRARLKAIQEAEALALSRRGDELRMRGLQIKRIWEGIRRDIIAKMQAAQRRSVGKTIKGLGIARGLLDPKEIAWLMAFRGDAALQAAMREIDAAWTQREISQEAVRSSLETRIGENPAPSPEDAELDMATAAWWLANRGKGR